MAGISGIWALVRPTLRVRARRIGKWLMCLLVLVLVSSLASGGGISGQTRWSHATSAAMGGDGRGLVQGGHSVTHHEGDAASLARMQAA